MLESASQSPSPAADAIQDQPKVADRIARTMHAYGLLLLTCSGLATAVLIAHNLGWLRALASISQEVVFTARGASYRAGHVHHEVRWDEVIRVELRRPPRAEPVLVFVTQQASCPVPPPTI